MQRSFIRNCIVLICVFFIASLLAGCSAEEVLWGIIEYTNEVTKEEIDKLTTHADENGYGEFVGFMKNELTEAERQEILNELHGSFIEGGMKKINHANISANFDYCYVDEVYIIPYGVHQIVKWASNIEIDKYNDRTMCRRYYKLINPDEDAYMLLKDETNNLYRVVKILANDSEENAEVEPEYTRDGFFTLFENCQSNVRTNLYFVCESTEMPRERLIGLYQCEYDFTRIYAYAQKLDKEAYAEAMEAFENKEFSKGIETILISKDASGKYYTYKNGVFVFDPQYYQIVRWSQNINKGENPDEYVVSDSSQDAYMVLFGIENKQILIHFISKK